MAVDPVTIEWLNAERKQLRILCDDREAFLEQAQSKMDQDRRELAAQRRRLADLETLINIAPRA